MIINKCSYIVILNYNAFQDTIECINSIIESNSKNYKIVLVDNFSDDNSLENLIDFLNTKSYNNIKIIKSNINKGYSSGNNLGIQYALKKEDCEYIWILNNDTIAKPDCLEELKKSDENSNVQTIWGSKILYENGQIQSLGCTIDKKFMLTYHNYNKYKNKDTDYVIDEIDYIHGCSIFFNKSIIDKIGLFSEDYFMFYDDVDFCKRAMEKNINLDVSQKSILIHKEGKTVKANKIEYLSVLNRIKYAKKYFPENIFYVYLGVIYKILKSFLLLKWNLSYNIIKRLF